MKHLRPRSHEMKQLTDLRLRLAHWVGYIPLLGNEAKDPGFRQAAGWLDEAVSCIEKAQDTLAPLLEYPLADKALAEALSKATGQPDRSRVRATGHDSPTVRPSEPSGPGAVPAGG